MTSEERIEPSKDGEGQQAGQSGTATALLGCVVPIVVFGAAVWAIKAWTDSWWGPPAVLLVLVVVVGTICVMPKGRRVLPGLLAVALALALLGTVFPSISESGDDRGPSKAPQQPSGHYTRDAFLRCKDILWGRDYPEDRLTPEERKLTIICAQG